MEELRRKVCDIEVVASLAKSRLENSNNADQTCIDAMILIRRLTEDLKEHIQNEREKRQN